MNFYYNKPSYIDASVIISIIALISSWLALYFQFFRKIKKLTLNVFHGEFPDSLSISTKRDIARNKISLSNTGSTSILIVNINYQTINNNNTSSTYQTNISPINLPLLLKSGESVIVDVVSNRDMFLNAIVDAEKTNHGSFKFKVFLKFSIVVHDKSAIYHVLIHETQYFNPEKVHHHYKGTFGINILEDKYLA